MVVYLREEAADGPIGEWRVRLVRDAAAACCCRVVFPWALGALVVPQPEPCATLRTHRAPQPPLLRSTGGSQLGRGRPQRVLQGHLVIAEEVREQKVMRGNETRKEGRSLYHRR